MITLADLLEYILPGVQPALIPPWHHRALREAAALFPAALARYHMLECRLGSEQPATDFPFCITQAERDALAGPGAFSLLDPAILDLPLWQNIRRFIAAWADPESEIYQKILMLWFEFDLDEALASSTSPLAAPGFFFGSREFPTDPSAVEDAWFFETALPLFIGGPPHPDQESVLRRILACLPRGAHLFQMGGFLARPSPLLRVCLTGIDPEEMLPYLRAVGYPSDLAGLEKVIAGLAPLCRIYLNLDVSTQIGEKIGLECQLFDDSLILMSEKEARLLALLEQWGVCAPAQQSALIDYPGIERWIVAGAEGDGAKPWTVLARDVSHWKVVFQPGKPLEAKAYLQVARSTVSALEFTANRLALAARRQKAAQALEAIRREQSVKAIEA
jgi:hypothetical protein